MIYVLHSRKPFPVVWGFWAVFKALLIHHWSVDQQQVNQKLPCWSGGLDTTYEGYLSRIISSLKTRHSILSNIEDKYKNNHHLPIHPLFDNLEYRWVIFPCNSNNNNNNNNNFRLSFLLSLHACLLTSIPLPPPFVWAHSTPIPATNWRFHRIPRACRKHGYMHGNKTYPTEKGKKLKNHRLKSAKKRIPLLNLIFGRSCHVAKNFTLNLFQFVINWTTRSEALSICSIHVCRSLCHL